MGPIKQPQVYSAAPLLFLINLKVRVCLDNGKWGVELRWEMNKGLGLNERRRMNGYGLKMSFGGWEIISQTR